MKKIFATLVIVLAAGFWSNAQTVIRNEVMTTDKDSVTVTFELDTDNTDLDRKSVV